MRRFILKTLTYLGALAVILTAVYLWLDPLRTLRYYPRASDEGRDLNYGLGSVHRFEHFNPQRHFDSFIVGSSYSMDWRVADVSRVLGDGRGSWTHLLSGSQNPEAAVRFVDYLIARADSVRHIVFVYDAMTFDDSGDDGNSQFFVSPPALYSGPRKLWQYARLAAYSLHRDMIFGELSHRLWGRFPRQPSLFPHSQWKMHANDTINELYRIGQEKWRDTATYEELVAAEPDRPDNLCYSPYVPRPDSEMESRLRRIAATLATRGIEYEFVIVPDAYGFTVHAPVDSLMREIFGEHYYNMSAEAGHLMTDRRNYYDRGHPRDTVSRYVMRLVAAERERRRQRR